MLSPAQALAKLKNELSELSTEEFCAFLEQLKFGIEQEIELQEWREE